MKDIVQLGISISLLLQASTALCQGGSELTRPNPAADDLFGATLAHDGDRIAVGSRGTAGDSGTLHLYDFLNNAWDLSASITIPTGESGARFSDGLALDGDTLFVGASLANVGSLNAGRVFVYERIGDNWIHTQTLEDPEPQEEAWFGVSCAIDGDVAVVGSREDADGINRSGSVFVYRKDLSGTWQFEAKLRAETPKTFGFFGHAVDIQGDRLVVGSIFGNGGAFESGTVRVFERFNGFWFQTAKLIPPGQNGNDFFGIDLSMKDNRVLIGARKNDSFGPDSGAAYLFENTTGTWTLINTFGPSEPQLSGEFGNKVSLSDSFAAIGAWSTVHNDVRGGACEIFSVRNDTFPSVKVIHPDQPTQFGSLGHDVDLDDSRLVLAAYEDDFYGNEAGKAWEMSLQGCLADVNGDGMVTPTDFTAWVSAFNSNAPECDQNGDGMCTPTDFTAWVGNYNAGC